MATARPTAHTHLVIQCEFPPGVPADAGARLERLRSELRREVASCSEALISISRRRFIAVVEWADAELARAVVGRTGLSHCAWPAIRMRSTAEAPSLRIRTRLRASRVVVERVFDAPRSARWLRQIEDGGAWCIDVHDVDFEQTYLAADATRMACFFGADDAESVRQVERSIGLPAQHIWAGES